MRKIDLLILCIGVIGAISWIIVSSKDGYKASNASIVARSISVTATIDGQVENSPPPVGKRVRSNDLLVRILNGRFDRSRLAEFESQISFLTDEITNLKSQQVELTSLLQRFGNRAESYSTWMLKEVALKRDETTAALKISQQQQELTAEEVSRAASLYKKRLASHADLQTARVKAEVAKSQVQLNQAQWKRNQLLLKTLERDGIFFDNGDTSYWAKMVDTLQVRILDNSAKIATLKTQLVQAELQAKVERSRIGSSYVEEHRAPFNGMVNAAFVNKGTRVTSGTSLYRILDCTQPLIIIPIPDNRITEFSVGMRVTVYPTDTEQELQGGISYVTSGALIGADTSLQIQPDLVLGGNRAVVTLDNEKAIADVSQSCETERKAVVVIHTTSWYDKVASWTATNLPELTAWLAFSQSNAADSFTTTGSEK